MASHDAAVVVLPRVANVPDTLAARVFGNDGIGPGCVEQFRLRHETVTVLITVLDEITPDLERLRAQCHLDAGVQQLAAVRTEREPMERDVAVVSAYFSHAARAVTGSRASCQFDTRRLPARREPDCGVCVVRGGSPRADLASLMAVPEIM
jgi:hypothetical protein